MPTKLSVNINKIATLRNARGGNNPDLIAVALDCEKFGADGITVHPRPDERHIRYEDVYELKKVLTIELALAVKPAQVTLVPDAIGQLTSNHGWDTITHQKYLTEILALFAAQGIRTSIFVDANTAMIQGAKQTGTDRIELYTEQYATNYNNNKDAAIANYITAANVANELGLGINAGHDLDLKNLQYFAKQIPSLLEVSIGHALVCDALYLGLQNTIQLYKRQLYEL
jgi:pyridoxine 5-phosphate synthase